jgi:arginase
LVSLGRGLARAVDPANVALIGVRQLDPGERDLLRQAGVTVFAMEQIDRSGLYPAVRRAIETASSGTDGIYLSLDLDVLDPVYAPGVGTGVDGGLTYREAHLACELIAESGRLVGMDVVEVNPILDERNRTARLAVELACSALGGRVWTE